MPSYVVSVLAATAVVGYDLFDGETWVRSPYERILTGVALKGSAAAGDTEIEIYIDEVRVGRFFNTNTGYPNEDDVLPQDDLFIPAGAQLRGIVRDAPLTNPIYARVDLEEAE